MWSYKTWFAGDTEYFSFGPGGYDGAAGTELMFPFLESLLQLLEMDMTAMEQLVAEACDSLGSCFETGDRVNMDRTMSLLSALGQRHVYFQLEYLRWFERHRAQDLKPEMVEELRQLPEQLKVYQRQIQAYFECVLDFELVGRETQKNARANPEVFPFQTIQVSFEPVDTDACGAVLYPNSIRDIIDFTLRECVTRGIPVRRCKNCGRYFPLLGRITAEYCSRPMGKRKACRDTGAALVWTKSQDENLGFREYRREYKRRFAWRKAGKITDEEFAAWGEAARANKVEYDEQKITLDELKDWMRNT